MFKVDLMGGEYTYIIDKGVQSALRNGEPWRKDDLVGDNLVLAMGLKIEELQNELNYARLITQVRSRGYFSKEDIQQLLSCKPEACKYIDLKEMFTKTESGYKLPVELYERSCKKEFTLPCKHDNFDYYVDFDPHKGCKKIAYCSDCGEEL